ncbi:hypothetical protein C1752_13120 [Acaryochloris thomasi RCC1774]|uniref:Uncharacterized protein n=1 Tax=Acaryochloris thomasi RCC1774 TaxID=1764569 RepID=A0A2W1JJF7_9CYAN|nr:hypothetical protein [Acaryochloris thomasi]PZD70394.1 hypothetical protein C1752_13120 [Acaryochloris thomasi RCC1774]
MSQDLSSENLQKTAADFREMGNQLTSRVLILQNELGDSINNGDPQDSIERKRDDIDLTSARINQCFTKAIELDTKAALGIITSTDVIEAVATIGCVTSKVKIAIDKLNKIRSALRFVAAFIDIGAALATLGTSGGVSFANIRVLIERIEALSKIDQDGLSNDEINQLLQACL